MESAEHTTTQMSCCSVSSSGLMEECCLVESLVSVPRRTATDGSQSRSQTNSTRGTHPKEAQASHSLQLNRYLTRWSIDSVKPICRAGLKWCKKTHMSATQLSETTYNMARKSST